MAHDVIRRFHRGLSNLPQAMHLADSVTILDNAFGQFTPPTDVTRFNGTNDRLHMQGGREPLALFKDLLLAMSHEDAANTSESRIDLT